MVVLPVGVALLVWLIVSTLWVAAGRRVRAIDTALVAGAVCVVITELLSLFDAITSTGVALAWSACAVASATALALLWRSRLRRGSDMLVSRVATARRERSAVWARASCLVLGLFLVVTLLIAVVSPPNNWDSMTYRLPRVMHWIQNGSLEFYPTAITRQNYMAPFAEMVILHLQLLSGGDRFANLVQWGAFVLSLFAVSELARLLGASRPAQWIAAVFAATLPMAVLQSTSTQNDLVASFFLLALFIHLVRFARGFDWRDAAFGGFALGLGLLTKGTIYVFGVAAGVCFAVFLIARWRAWPSKGAVMGAVLASGLIAAALNLGHWTRNYRHDGHPLGRETMELRNERIDSGTLTSNLLRNGAIHTAVPVERINRFVVEVCRRLVGDLIEDRAITWRNEPFSIRYAAHEDYSGNVVHFACLIGAAVLAALRWRRMPTISWPVFGSVALGAVLFCLLLKWQPWASRLHTPIFLVGAAWMSVVFGLGRAREEPEPATGPLRGYRVSAAAMAWSLAAVLWAQPFLWQNRTRPLLPADGLSLFGSTREELLFANRPDLREDYERLAEYLRSRIAAQDVVRVGLLIGRNDWEYPLWRLSAGGFDPRLSIRSLRDARNGAADFDLVVTSAGRRSELVSPDGVCWNVATSQLNWTVRR